MITGKKILVTGASGSVGRPIATALAADNQVWGLARYTDPDAKDRLETAGVRTIAADLAALSADDMRGLLPEVDHVLHFAIDMFDEPDFERTMRHNIEPLGLLLSRYRDVDSFLHCSSTVVYEAHPEPRAEDDPLGDFMRPVNPTYSLSKIASEAAVRSVCRLLGVPTTIARLNVPYSVDSGFPMMNLTSILAGEPIAVHPDFPDVFAPIHVYDMIRTLPALLGAASTPAAIVNWGGDEQVGLSEWCTYLGELSGREVTFLQTQQAVKGMCPDVGRLRELVGGPVCSISWRDGMRAMVEASAAASRTAVDAP
ncbi:NAD(P)-dependent oxidoreductase [Pseudonocardia aurantiaca]|uniref:NAD-dependent epimerase/dehydratase family protein n=1 Tax=Pseudonocardia aurantiaca TaxID=75290 RepID=A0ABW4FQK1_9PSEU